MSRAKSVSAVQLIFGLALLAAGLFLTLDRLRILHAQDYLRFWPLILIAVGLVKLTQPRKVDRLLGVILAVLGGWLQLHQLGWVRTWPGDYFLPAVLLLIGGTLVMGGIRRRQAEPGEAADSWLHAFAFWAGLKRQSTSPSFRGADLTAIMGGIEVDLRHAEISQGTAEIRIFCMWGGIEFRVPKGWRLDIQVLPLLGGYDDKTDQELTPDAPTLVIKGTVLMAGADISN